MTHSYISDSVEILYLNYMLIWEERAPKDRNMGYLDGKKIRNAQWSRMADCLVKIATGNVEKVLNAVSVYAHSDVGQKCISKNASELIEPYPLIEGWYLEKCLSLKQKLKIMQQLSKLGLSSKFVSCVCDFVANKPIHKYVPSYEEQMTIVEKLSLIQLDVEDVN